MMPVPNRMPHVYLDGCTIVYAPVSEKPLADSARCVEHLLVSQGYWARTPAACRVARRLDRPGLTSGKQVR